MSVKPHDYQQKGIDEINQELKTKKSILYQLSTGGGKTFVFSFLTKQWKDEKKGKVLILCHRSELVDQTILSMNRIGVTCEAITSSTKKAKHTSDCYVAMIETANNRLLNDPYFFKGVTLVIADECHILIFNKVFGFFKESKILGCSATPVVMKRIKFWKCKYCKRDHDAPALCCDTETAEWTKPFAMSMLYENIVIGPNIDELIERGILVKEISIAKNYADDSVLKVGADGEFTPESMDEAYSGDNAAFNVLLNYKQYCEGKKTMIFNSTSKSNLELYNKFKEEGLNVRMYDSVNKEQSGNRKELIAWFKSTPDAILMNVGVFTTGFDDKTVQAVIMNVPTMSLSLFIQIVGRGARSSTDIYKPNFIFIDGGGNIDRHLEFSDPTRDWVDIFFNGIGKPKAKKMEAFDIQACMNCGALHARSEECCPECGHIDIPEEKPKFVPSLSEEVLTPIRAIPAPNGKTIYAYTVLKKENINFAFKILIEQVIDMFRFYRVTKAAYEKSLRTSELLRKVNKMVNKCYFFLLSKVDIKAENNRTIKYLIDKILIKLEKLYGN